MNFRPCIDIHNGKVKQIVGGTLNNESSDDNFVSSEGAEYYAAMYKNDGLSGGHIALLNRHDPQSLTEVQTALEAYPGGLQFGGGVNDENALFFLKSGASHVIVTSFIFTNGELDYNKLEKIAVITGKNRLVLDLSCRYRDGEYIVVTDRWQTFTKTRLTLELLDNLGRYCDEFLIHGVDVEGKKAGIDSNLIALLAPWEKSPMTYAGGIRGFEDIEEINRASGGRMDFTVGSALDIFGGNLSYEELVKKTKNINSSLDMFR